MFLPLTEDTIACDVKSFFKDQEAEEGRAL